MVRRKHDQKRKLASHHWLGLCGWGGMLVLGALLVNPTFTMSSNASAESLNSTLSTKTTASLYSMLSIALSDSIDIDITPKAAGALGVGKARLNVTTNNTTGYSIYLSTVDGSNSLNAIDQGAGFVGAEETSYAINALAGNTTYDNYLNNQANLNTWGYALTDVNANAGDTVYAGLNSAQGDSIYHTNATTSNDTYDLNIVVAVDASLPAGGYRNGIVVSAVANPISISGFKSIYYMQEMTPEICDSAKEHEEGQLVDKRDNKIYWVGKLKDGRCWMTQNLDLDLSTDVALTPEDSNVTESWTPEVSTSMEIPQVEDVPNHDQIPLNSYNPGAYTVKNPSAFNNCRQGASLAECSDAYADVSGFHPGFVATETSSIDAASSSYDAHYLVGNYYNPNVAYVGKDNLSINRQTFNEDICPKGWRLPSGVTVTGTTTYEDMDWYQLLATYGWDTGYVKNTAWSNFYYTMLDVSTQNIAAKPLYLVQSGVIRPFSMDTDGSPTVITNSFGVYFITNSKTSSSAAAILVIGSDKRLYPGSAASWEYNMGAIRCIAK